MNVLASRNRSTRATRNRATAAATKLLGIVVLLSCCILFVGATTDDVVVVNKMEDLADEHHLDGKMEAPVEEGKPYVRRGRDLGIFQDMVDSAQAAVDSARSALRTNCNPAPSDSDDPAPKPPAPNPPAPTASPVPCFPDRDAVKAALADTLTAEVKYGPIKDWCFDAMSFSILFESSNFNTDISGWDTSKITNMEFM